MESSYTIEKNDLYCPICTQMLKDPVKCDQCKKSFCSMCIESYKKTKNEKVCCPHCKKEESNFIENIILKKVIKKVNGETQFFECKKCKKKFENHKDNEEHEKKCSPIKCEFCEDLIQKEEKDKREHICYQIRLCKLCGKEFGDLSQFIDHFDLDKKCNGKIEIMKSFDLNKHDIELMINDKAILKEEKNEKNEIDNMNMDLEENIIDEGNNKIKRTDSARKLKKFQNNYTKRHKHNEEEESIKEKKIIEYLERKGYKKFYKSNVGFCFCGRTNELTGESCKMGNLFCKKCMDINKRIHEVPYHYLINRAGRACRFEKGKYRCEVVFSTEIKDDRGNTLVPDMECGKYGEFCQPCDEINKIMEKNEKNFYISQDTIDKLKKRDLAANPTAIVDKLNINLADYTINTPSG